MTAAFFHSIGNRLWIHTSHSADLPPYNGPDPSEMEAYNPDYGQVQESSQEPELKWNVLFVGGILNKEDNVAANVEELRSKTCPAIGLFWNNVYALHRHDRVPKPVVVEALAGSIKEYLTRGRLCIVAHSHGAKVVALALENLMEKRKIKPYERDLEVYTYGGVTTVEKAYARRVENYRNKDDSVQLLGTLAWHEGNGTPWEISSPKGGHQFIEGYADHAAGKVNDFIVRSSTPGQIIY